ncbi:phosphate ABC transporter substrate-binding protein [Leptolyngbya sp. 'hensonii']|uniref:PstS family phosphate ABC transporter substrate-binding protein n=1 Tax=Leptolyngbya sp. 'hensonii' TaxID=1922337 RepID=UPI00094FBE2A|nr:PstS family phosphate ABC transporter substrate-binding protein [Leptolyngbya sp. 'hensonii']OLP18969.1 phosphate ABC transporter substrate-binding protein [Leptolyngbya sp. 'hensonii']
MASKNETPILILSLLITLGMAGGGLWWFSKNNSNFLPKLNSGSQNTSSPSASPGTGNPPSNAPTSAGNSFVDVKSVPNGVFNYGGSTTWAPIRRDVDPLIQTTLPGFKLRYTDAVNATPGSGTGIRMLLDDQLAFSQSSRPIKNQEYQQAQQRGYRLRQVPVAIEGLAIAVHPSLSIPGLTLTQVRDIYTGKTTNWQQVGGPDLPITPYSRRASDGGTVEFFIENLLTGQPLGRNVTYVYSTTQALRSLAKNPGGIYYASAPEVVPQCQVKPLPIARQGQTFIAPYTSPLVPASNCPGQRNQLNGDAFKSGSYPITRQMFVIIKQNGSIEQQAGEAYANLLLTDQGQDLITRAGFVRIR